MMDEALGRLTPPQPTGTCRRAEGAESQQQASNRMELRVLSRVEHKEQPSSGSDYAGTWAPTAHKPTKAELNKRREYNAWRQALEESATNEVRAKEAQLRATPINNARALGQSASWLSLPARIFATSNDESALPHADRDSQQQHQQARPAEPWLSLW